MNPVENDTVIAIPDENEEISASMQQHPQSQGCCRGRIYKDWTQAFSTFGIVIGGAGITYSLLGFPLLSTVNIPYVVTAFTAFLVATNILSCARVSCLKPEKELNDNVAALKKRNRELEREVRHLFRATAALTKTKDELKAVGKDASEMIREMKDIFEKQIDNLNALAERLEATELKLQTLQKLYNDYKKETVALAKELNRFNKKQRTFGQDVSELKNHVNNIDVKEDELSEEIDQFDDANDYLKQENTRLQTILYHFQNEKENLFDRFTQIRDALAELRQHVLKLDEADDKYLEGAKRFRELIPIMADLVSQLEEEDLASQSYE